MVHCGNGVWFLRPGHKRHCSICLAPLDHSLWEKPGAMSVEYSGSPMEKYTGQGMEASCQQP